MSAARCPNCAAGLPPDAKPGGWCEACGKPIPSFAFAERDEPAPEPDGPTLPVDDTPFQYRYPVPIVLGVMFAAIVGFVVAYPFGLVARVAAGIVAGTAILVCVVVLIVNATLIPKLNRDLLALQSGDHLAKWEYSSAEWLRFAAAEWRCGRRWALLVALGLVACWALATWKPHVPPAHERDFFGLAAVAGGAVFFGLVMLASAWRTYRKRRAKVGVAFIGHGVAVAGGRCAMWGRAGWALHTVRVTDGNPSVLEIVLNAAENTTTFRVPIPRGREAEANRLVSKLMHGG